MSPKKIGSALAAGFVVALLSLSIGAGIATAANSRQKAATAAHRYHHASAGHRLYGSVATSAFGPRGKFEASYGGYSPPQQDPLDAWDGYFADPVGNPNFHGDNGL